MGGGVMRAAAKVAGIGGVVHGGTLRGRLVPSPSGQSIGKASTPVAATLTAQNVGNVDVSPIEKTELDAMDDFVDWQVIGAADEELVMSAGEPMPRVVFDAAPSFKEAREAATELKDALDKIYLSSPKSTEFGEQSAADKVSGLSQFTNPEPEEVESRLLTRTSVPKHALQAFDMLSRSAEAQNVVASIASDPNIWNAMMENSAVKQFLESNKNYNLCEPKYASATELSDPVSPKKHEDCSPQTQRTIFGPNKDKSDGFEAVLHGFVQKIKLTVDRCMNDLSTYIQNIFPSPAESGDADENGNPKMAVASAFMGLAVMVVMVVLMKRS